MSPDSKPDQTAILEELKQTQLAYQMATEMSKFKAGFLARTSHELRSPLSSLISLHQLVLADLCDDPAEERETITQAHAAALRLVKLLDEIIAVSKIEHGSSTLSIESVHLKNIFEEVYNLTHLQAANRNFPLEISFPAPDIYVKADSRRLRQVLVNLVDMAITRMNEGSIYLSASPSPTSGYIHIWIDADYPNSIWSEPTDLLQSPPQKQENPVLSTGMNLLINQTILELMQGKLELVTSPIGDNFSRLQCDIPLAVTSTS